jgi:hypothetical protein
MRPQNFEKRLSASSCRFVLLSVCVSVRSHGTTVLQLDGLHCEHFSLKFTFRYNMTRITGTLHETVFTFMITSRSFLIRMRNVLKKKCRENQNTHFVFNSFFSSKTVSFMRKCGKIWYSQTGHR